MDTYIKYAENVVSRLSQIDDTPTNDLFISMTFGAHLFEISRSTQRLMFMTKSGNDEIKLPFDSIFIELEPNESTVLEDGTAVLRGVHVTAFTSKIDDRKAHLFNSVFMTKTGEIFNLTFTHGMDINDIFPTFPTEIRDRERKRMENTCVSFVRNVLDLINTPDVKIVDINPNPNRNSKRLNKGKAPIPHRHSIRLTGELKRYVKKVVEGGHFHYNHKFWVRGHFRTLRHEKYGENVGKKVWIPPYIKGKGMLLMGSYKIDKCSDGQPQTNITQKGNM